VPAERHSSGLDSNSCYYVFNYSIQMGNNLVSLKWSCLHYWLQYHSVNKSVFNLVHSDANMKLPAFAAERRAAAPSPLLSVDISSHSCPHGAHQQPAARPPACGQMMGQATSLGQTDRSTPDHFSFIISVWSPCTITARPINKLESVQRVFTKRLAYVACQP